jgi:hypothetical protein
MTATSSTASTSLTLLYRAMEVFAAMPRGPGLASLPRLPVQQAHSSAKDNGCSLRIRAASLAGMSTTVTAPATSRGSSPRITTGAPGNSCKLSMIPSSGGRSITGGQSDGGWYETEILCVRCLGPRADQTADDQIGLVIRQKVRVDFKGLAVAANAENGRVERKKHFPDGRGLREDDPSNFHVQEAAGKPDSLLIKHQGSVERIAAHQGEHAPGGEQRESRAAEPDR